MKYIIAGFFVLCISANAFSQDEEFWEEYLQEEVEVENPVYKPVIGFGVGFLNFLGDVRNDYSGPLTGQVGYKVNIATYVDNWETHLLRANFFFISGKLSGYRHSVDNFSQSLNFQSDIFNFGLNLNYNFKNFYKQERKLYPFVSVGLETFLFDSKMDLLTNRNGEDIYYEYWSDGTIRDIPEVDRDIMPSKIISRDYFYETNFSENIFDKDLPAQNYSFAIPVDVGLDFSISTRATLRIGTSLHFTFTDFLDNLSGTYNEYTRDGRTTDFGGNLKNDIFGFTYATIHLDLFSDDKVILQNRLLAMIENDPTMIGDEDADMVFDISDECLGTPFGVEVDTLGCPLDTDNDGVPDYQDLEANTPTGAFVDENGVKLTEDQIIALLNSSEAVRRDEVELILKNYSNRSNYQRGPVEVPPRFRSVDKDTDGYISFEEVLDAIDSFFDLNSDLTTQEIYELNEFFFSQ